MPEDQFAGPDLARVLEHIDDFALNAQNYQTIQGALEKSQGDIEVPVVEKLLAICVRDLKEDMKNTVNTLNVIVSVLKKVKAGELSRLPDLVPSAVAVLHIIKTTALLNKVEGLKMLCFEVLQSYPNDVLIKLAVSHYSEIIEMLNLYCHQRIPLDMRLQPMNIVYKILKILPPDKRKIFVRDGVGIWFSKIVPTVMSHSTSVNSKNMMPIETLEMLTEELVSIDYANNPNWRVVLDCIYAQQKYPAIIKNLLDSGSDLWYRLWIVFIKLLKHQITQTNHSGKVASPINSMLPAVETAFKMNVKNRCRAFLCWNVLIDNFSTETNEVYINKRLKLLMIPLTSNNAKVEETVIAKLNTWWHLIRQFETKIESCFETILLPFLHFCFGKPAVPEKPVFAPGLLTINTKRQVLQAFANVAGHINCDCTVNMSKLNRKILSSNNLLVDHWDNWTNSLTMTIRICVNDNSDSVMQHFKCIWKSFIANIAEVSKSTDRHNLFVELLAILEVLLQSPRCDKLADIIFNIVTYSLLDHNGKVQPLFNAENVENNPIHKIVSLILNPSLDYVFTRYDAKEIVAKMKPLTKLIAEEYLKEVTERYLKSLLVKNNSLMLWTALTEAICELKCEPSAEILRNMLILPLRSMSLFTSVEISTTAWILLHKYSGNKLKGSAIDEEIYEIISNQTFTSTINKKFIFRATLAILDGKIDDNNDTLTCSVAETLQLVVKGMDFTFVEDDVISYLNITVLLLKKVDKELNEKLARTCILIVNNILRMISGYYKDHNEDISQISDLIMQILEYLDLLLKKEICSNISFIILDDLKKYIPYFKHSGVLSILNSMLNHKTSKNETPSPKTSPVDKSSPKEKLNASSTDDQNKFATPVIKPVTKKGKKKDSNIVDTVVENGEEYLVVNTNWKFNIKKLTDNQKEKMQRTREDIPALYQDLSQSQDEFKKIYRANSIDSMSGSKLTTDKEDASEVLKNIACSNVVPRIIENILTESGKKDCADVPRVDNAPTVTENPFKNIENDKNIDTKTIKSPRVALKDRVFRNVRNLIEKSGLQKNDLELNATASEDLLKTPPAKLALDSNLANSAPSDISSDRPSRLKRKPKKFDDLNLLSGKRRRNSANQNNSEAPTSNLNQTPELESQPKKSKLTVVREIDSSADNEASKAETLPDEKTLDVVSKVNTEVAATSTVDAQDNTPTIIPSNDKVLTEKLLNNEKQNTNGTDLPCAPDVPSETDSFNLSDDKNLPTPNKPNKEESPPTQPTKKTGRRKSRIEKELAIDMVEGHPFLKMQSEKRLTRKNISTVSPATAKRKSLVEKLNKSKTEATVTKPEKKVKNKDKSMNTSDDKLNDSIDDVPSSQSQDIIESSQESSVSTISLKPTKKPKRVPIVSVEPCNDIPKALKQLKEKKEVVNSVTADETLMSQDTNDPEITHNKSVAKDRIDVDLTENMATQPVEEESSGEVIILSGDEAPIVINSEQTNTESSQNTANDVTQSLDLAIFTEEHDKAAASPVEPMTIISEEKDADADTPNMTTQIFDAAQATENNDCSPFKDDVQRKQDFMNNTLEISPIKILSPMPEEKKSHTPETSSDFVVITLSSPVHSNGEPFDKSDSPEIFSNERISPDKRDQSPPREEFIMTNLSPSSSLSLKKNRPQVRSSGRAAQMLGLCVPDRMQTLMNSEKPPEPEEHKRSMALNTSARRNLRILYNSTAENSDDWDDSDDDSYLRLKRCLPTADSSPVGPILKRKHRCDDGSDSPASKRKRVSFHDPPVSTTMSVRKYIDQSKGLHSPQNSAFKRQERQLRAQGTTKTPKRLDTAFKLDTALTKTVESFTENANDNDTDISETAADVTNELSETEPIFPALIHCKDRIDKIITELSSPAMKLLLIREMEGRIETVGDFAKLTPVEMNTLSIKTPKVNVAKRVLKEYSRMSEELSIDISDKRLAGLEVEINMQAAYEEMQIEPELLVVATQTDRVSVCNNLSQTNESGASSTAGLIKTCLERPDFINELCVQLDDLSKQEIARNMTLKALTEELLKKVDSSKSFDSLSALLDHQRSLLSPENPSSITQLSIIQSYLCDKFDSKDIIMFCSELLRKAYEKS